MIKTEFNTCFKENNDKKRTVEEVLLEIMHCVRNPELTVGS